MARNRLLVGAVLGALVPTATAQDRVAGDLRLFNDNGAWSWFEDERAIVDRLRGRVLVGSCADGSGVGGSARSGDIDLAWLDVSAGRFGYFELQDRLEDDDHDTPALMVRPDGRYLAVWARHGGDSATRFRISTQPGDPTAWSPLSTFSHGAGVTYSNVYRMRDTGRTYSFCRALNYDPNVCWSDDDGQTWSVGGKLLTEGGGGDRPYLRYTSDGAGRVHFIASNRHPRNFDNSIWHGYVENDALHDSFGNVVDANVLDGSGTPPSGLTPVFVTGTSSNGTVMRRGWTIDCAVDAGGVVRVLFQMRANDSNQDHRLFFGRFDGTSWTTNEVCRLGGYLYWPEDDYTGLAALHPDRPDTIYVSTPIDPSTNATLAHYEIFEATTPNGGASWTWSAVTSDSTVDNLRPIVPSWDDQRTALLWFRGEYSTYTDWHAAVVGRIEAPEAEVATLTYVDATTGNTTMSNGQPVVPTGPAAGMGPTDNAWHLRSGFGNGGSVWTSSEASSENAPELRTRLTGLAPRLHDVFLFFWSNPNEDWRIRAGFAPGQLRNFEKRACATVDPLRYGAAPVVTGSTVRAYQVWLGRARPDANGALDVYVDDFTSGSTQLRTWYDGVAVAPVEAPAATAIVGHACNGSIAPFVSAPPQLGATVQLGAVGAAANAFAVLQFGGGELEPLSLAILGEPDCTLLVQNGGSLSLGVCTPAGTSPTLSLAVPANPALHGGRVAVQPWALSAGGFEMGPAAVLLPGQ